MSEEPRGGVGEVAGAAVAAVAGVVNTALDGADSALDVLLAAIKAAKAVGAGGVQGGVNVASASFDSAIAEIEKLKTEIHTQAKNVTAAATGK